MEDGLHLLAESQSPFYSTHILSKKLRLEVDLLQANIITGFIAVALLCPGAATGISTGHAYFLSLQAAWILGVAVKSLQRVDVASDIPQRMFEFAREASLETTDSIVEPPQDWPSLGKIELQDVHAYYSPANDATQTFLDTSLSILPGEHIGIAGRSGSGKSSLVLTLLRFIPYHGSITIDGIEISSIAPDKLRSHIITIPEDPVIFDGTIRANLVPCSMNEPTAVHDAQRDLQLELLLQRLHIWLPLSNKGGLDAKIDEVSYSKSDNQLVCIARAIMRQREIGRKVILIDDATSCLSAERERIASDLMKEFFESCTVLRSSIRESGLEGAEAVVHFHRGVIVDPDQVDYDSESDLDEDGE